MDLFTLKLSIFWLCTVSGIIAISLILASVLFHHFRNQKEERSGLTKEMFWLFIAGLMILFMVFPAGRQMVDDYLDTKPSGNAIIDESVVLNAIKTDPTNVM